MTDKQLQGKLAPLVSRACGHHVAYVLYKRRKPQPCPNPEDKRWDVYVGLKCKPRPLPELVQAAEEWVEGHTTGPLTFYSDTGGHGDHRLWEGRIRWLPGNGRPVHQRISELYESRLAARAEVCCQALTELLEQQDNEPMIAQEMVGDEQRETLNHAAEAAARGVEPPEQQDD